MMKKYSFLILISIFMASCMSSQKMLQRGQYDRAIEKSAGKLAKKPGNEKELNVLTEAFELANMFDLERIEFLEKEGLDESHVEIYDLYEQLNRRQNIVRRLPSQVRSQFSFVNYDDNIIESKAAAANISYRRGLDYLRQGGRINARRAYSEFETANSIYPGYEDVNDMLVEAHQLGISHSLFMIENESEMILPEDFDEELRKVSLKDLNTFWLNFDTNENDLDYNFFLVLSIKEIDISPESVDRRTYTETREIQDGMKYDLDENGNVKKDSLGNDIRVPNMVTVSAEVQESVQQKTALVGGSLDIYDIVTDQLVKTDRISVEAVFSHSSAEFSGNSEALSEETARFAERSPVPFPGNEAMLMDAASLLKEQSKSIISRNRRMLEE
ncbi:MAG: hypothetical protein WD604_18150 [Balneolaceae bacterium]